LNNSLLSNPATKKSHYPLKSVNNSIYPLYLFISSPRGFIWVFILTI